MSRNDKDRMASKRSKMDRYTEDLKYSLRRRLSESVAEGSLRTDDILARSHRQVVADFTDPRQWYYSATHDYIIGLMRESQKQNGGSVFGGERSREAGSRKGERRSLASRGHLPSSATGISNRNGARSKSLFVVVPTETAHDLEEIRGHGGAKTRGSDSSSETKQKDILDGRKEDTMRSEQTAMFEESRVKDWDNEIALGASLVHSQPFESGDADITGKHGNASQFGVNSNQDISRSLVNGASTVETMDESAKFTHEGTFVETGDLKSEQNAEIQENLKAINSDSKQNIHSSEELGKADDYDGHAIEAYKAAKKSQLPHVTPRKLKAPSSVPAPVTHALEVTSHLPARIKPFVPIKQRNNIYNNNNKQDDDLSLPPIGKPPDSPTEQQTKKLRSIRRGRVDNRKRRLGPLDGLERVRDKPHDMPYVEDWIRKLQLDDRELAKQRQLQPIERIDGAFPHVAFDAKRQDSDLLNQLQTMSLPDDFQPLGTFQSFQPLTSLYLYSLKQRSDLNVKFQYLQIPKPLKQKMGNSDQKPTFKDDLGRARSKMDHVEGKLGELYQAETGLGKIVTRGKVKPKKKQVGWVDVMNIERKGLSSKGTSSEKLSGSSARKDYNANPLSHTKMTERTATMPAANDGVLTSKQVHFEERHSPELNSPSKMSVVSLTLPPNGKPQSGENKETTESISKIDSLSSGDDFHAASTSSWKQPSTSSDRPKEVKAIEGKLVRVFDDRGHERENRSDKHSEVRLPVDSTVVIASVHDCNAMPNDPVNNPGDEQLDEQGDEEMEDEKIGSQLTDIVQEVIHDIMDRIESPDEIVEQYMYALSTDVSETLSLDMTSEDTPKQVVIVTEQEDSQTRDAENEPAHSASSLGQCLFCDEPH